MRQPALRATLKDKAIQRDVVGDSLHPDTKIHCSVATLKKNLPSALPMHGSGRALQPHGVTVGDAKSSEQNGKRVADKGSIEMR